MMMKERDKTEEDDDDARKKEEQVVNLFDVSKLFFASCFNVEYKTKPSATANQQVGDNEDDFLR